jgi:hypothetical protein
LHLLHFQRSFPPKPKVKLNKNVMLLHISHSKIMAHTKLAQHWGLFLQNTEYTWHYNIQWAILLALSPISTFRNLWISVRNYNIFNHILFNIHYTTFQATIITLQPRAQMLSLCNISHCHSYTFRLNLTVVTIKPDTVLHNLSHTRTK